MLREKTRSIWAWSTAVGAAIFMLVALISVLSVNVVNAGIQASNDSPANKTTEALTSTTIVINEFAAKGTEWIELYNVSGGTIDITGWYLDDANCGAGTSFIGAVTVPSNDFFVVNSGDAGDNFTLDNSGGFAVLCDDTHIEIDRVAFGDEGHAPIGPAAAGSVQYSTARVVDGVDTDDDAQDWNMDQSPTKGTANDVPGNDLGGSVIINEIDVFPVGANDFLELFNPTGSTITVTDWYVSDGDDVAQLTGTLVIPPGGFLEIFEDIDWVEEGSTGSDFGSTDVAYLFDENRVRVDQLGWAGEFEDGCYARVPDGAGPNDGYNFVTSGGGLTLFDQTCTYGNTNISDLGVSKTGPVAVINTDPIVYDISISNPGGVTATDVILSDTLPMSVTYASDNSGYPCPACTVGASGTITWFVGDVPSSTLVSFQLTGTINMPGLTQTEVITNLVEIESTLGGDDPGNNSDTWVTSVGPEVQIHDIQGAAHLSLYDGLGVAQVHGIVTVVSSNGFYMQDPNPDADPATSEAIFVFTSSAPGVSVGDEVLVDGVVDEYYPGGFGSGNLSTTELTSISNIDVVSTGNPLPAATVLGTGGRIPPNTVIDNDSSGDVNTTPTFDPAEDGIDFYESLEAMLVQVNDAVVTGSNFFGEIMIVGDSGTNATVLSPRGSLVISDGDLQPEKIILDDTLVTSEPDVNVGDAFTDIITGVVDYSFGNFKVYNVNPLPGITPAGNVSETTTLSGTADHLTVGSMNVENLDPGDDQQKFDVLAHEIVNLMLSPDIISLQEVQDNNGPTNDGVTDAGMTYGDLIIAIAAAGGPTYEYRDIAPLDNTDGGQPGGNIRVGFLFRPERVTFVDRPGGDATTPTVVGVGSTGVELSVSPGRIDPTNMWFNDSRKPLVGEFIFNDHKVFVIAGHFNSKGGDDPLFGRVQPPVLGSEISRTNQAQIVNDFVDAILALDPNANVVVAGDLNDFQFSPPLLALKGAVLQDLVEDLPLNEQYTYIYDGNAQVLDHILVSNNLYDNAMPEVDIVHANAEYIPDNRQTDHDPLVTRLHLPVEPDSFEVYFPIVLKPEEANGGSTAVTSPMALLPSLLLLFVGVVKVAGLRSREE